jgi:hypothetical protein
VGLSVVVGKDKTNGDSRHSMPVGWQSTTFILVPYDVFASGNRQSLESLLHGDREDEGKLLC